VRQRTYWHLEKFRRRPSDYDIGSSNLLYYIGRGFEVNVPIDAWYKTYQRGSPLVSGDWERFRDPRETTYAKYTELQRTKETFVEGLLRHAEAAGHDARLAPEWLRTLSGVLPPLRYPVHGLQMISAYIGHMAPSGRIVIASLFQAADEMRTVQRVAYRMRQLMSLLPGFGENARTLWQGDPAWQPTREIIEKLLVTYDWGEAFVALNLVFKPRFDELWMRHFAARCQSEGDDLFAKILFSLDEDARWHREWSRALVRMAIEDHAENVETIGGWLKRWTPLARRAIAPFAQLVDAMTAAKVEAACLEHLESAGLPTREGS